MVLYGYPKRTGASDGSGAGGSRGRDGKGSGIGDADAAVSGLLSGSGIETTKSCVLFFLLLK
jgi:hypothetical protein